MKKDSFIREKNIKVCYSNIEPKKVNIWEVLYSDDEFYIYTIVTKEKQTFRKVKKQYKNVYKKLLKVRKRMYQITSKGRLSELKDVYKKELKLEFELKSILKYIKNISIDVERINRFFSINQECDFNKNDLKFLQLLLLNSGDYMKIPRLEQKEKDLIIKKDNRYTI